jgi:hypothetical protein
MSSDLDCRQDAYELLTRFARLHIDEETGSKLREATQDFKDWEPFVRLAEQQLMAPLVYAHVRDLQLSLPQKVKLQLQGLYLRHSRSNAVLMSVLEEILALFEAHSIQTVVVKGAALANLVYSEIALRPMRDIDVLVHESDMKQAHELLTNDNFQVIGSPLPADSRHMPILYKARSGRRVSLEIHGTLSSGLLSRGTKTMTDLRQPLLKFQLGEIDAFSLRVEDLLWHLYQHMILEPIRLIRFVDFVSVAECFRREIEWDYVRTACPIIVDTLSLFHHVSPLSDELRLLGQINIGKRPNGASQPLIDWPPAPRAQWRNMRSYEILKRTFFPSEFALRVYSGRGSGRSIAWHRWLIHPWSVFVWYLKRRFSD